MEKVKAFLFKNNNTNQTILKNSFWLGFGELSSRLIKVFIIFYAIRILGVSDWGAFSYAISLCALYMVFSDLGLTSILTRELSKDDNMKEKHISTSFLIKIFINLIIFLLILLTGSFFSKNVITKDILIIVSLLMIFEGMRDFIFAINRSMEKMEVEAMVKILTNILLVIFTYIFLINSKTVHSLALGYMLGSLSGLIFTLIIFRKHLKNLFKNFSLELVKPLVTIAWPFAFFAILGSIMSSTDVVMLGWMKDVDQVGYYSTSQRIVAFLYIIPGLITSSLLPTLSKQIHDKEKISSVVHSSIKLIYLFSIPLVFGSLVAGDQLITTLFGMDYSQSANIFRIAILNIIFAFPALIFNSIIFIFNRHKSIIKISLIGTVLNVCINFILIPKFGGLGAAITTLISQIVTTILMKKELEKIIKIKIFNNLSKIILASLIMSIFLFVFKYTGLNIYLSIIFSTVIYFIILLKIKEDSILKVTNIMKE